MELASLDVLKQQKITELLRTISPAQAALLSRAVAAMRESGSAALPTDLILEALAPAANIAPSQRPSLREIISIPLEPFLTEEEQRDVGAGLIHASVVELWWEALMATAGGEIAAI